MFVYHFFADEEENYDDTDQQDQDDDKEGCLTPWTVFCHKPVYNQTNRQTLGNEFT